MNEKWIDEFWNKMERKLSMVAPQVKIPFPYTLDDSGKYIAYHNCPEDTQWWTNGFWGGMLWLAYKDSKKEMYRDKAIDCEKALDKAFLDFYDLGHDVGFMWHLTAVEHYKQDGDVKALNRGLHAATLLAGRFNCRGNFLRAWNSKRHVGATIIDSMMNLPLLYWASEVTGDPRFRFIAEQHAETVKKYFIRTDGSVNHIVMLDPETGDMLENPGGQGYASGSSWSRGQAWAIYGFIQSYLYTGNSEYLEIAKRVAHYFIANLSPDGVPVVDFRAPEQPVLKDTTAGAVAVCGLIEIMRLVGENEKVMYERAIEVMLQGLEKNCDFTMEKQSILQNGTERYSANVDAEGVHISIIYGDYYLMDALLKLREGR